MFLSFYEQFNQSCYYYRGFPLSQTSGDQQTGKNGLRKRQFEIPTV